MEQLQRALQSKETVIKDLKNIIQALKEDKAAWEWEQEQQRREQEERDREHLRVLKEMVEQIWNAVSRVNVRCDSGCQTDPPFQLRSQNLRMEIVMWEIHCPSMESCKIVS